MPAQSKDQHDIQIISVQLKLWKNQDLVNKHFIKEFEMFYGQRPVSDL